MPVLTYLNFNGICREVLEFYRSVFGGEYLIMQTFGDGPDDMGIAESDKDKICLQALDLPRWWATTSR